MGKTFRVNPETFEEAQERNHLKRKKKEDKEHKVLGNPFNYIITDDSDEDWFFSPNDGD